MAPAAAAVAGAVAFGAALLGAAVPAAATASASHDCDLGVVGAGPGGAYAAWRAAEAGMSVCVFERNHRPGGRIHSLRGQGPKGDLVVEAGGYRFAPKPVVEKRDGALWRVFTPLTAKVVEELHLPSVAYNPNASEWDHGMHKIVNEAGQDAGYLTFIERLMELAVAKGAHARFGTAVASLRDASEGEEGEAVQAVALKLESGEEVVAKSVVLNLAQRPLVELLRRSGGALANEFPAPLYNPVSFPIMKLYVHYDDAWWRNELNLTAGEFRSQEPAAPGPSIWSNIPVESPAPLYGRYHDGDVRCDLPGGRCRGFLQAFYGGDDDGAVRFYGPFSDSTVDDPAKPIGRELAHHRELLDMVHSSLVRWHKDALSAAGALERVEKLRPTGGVLTIWDQGVAGIHAGCHFAKRYPSGEFPKPGSLAKSALQPVKGWPLFVANEAYGPMPCFAEASLAMAEAALGRLDVALPSSGWLEEEFVQGLLEPETYADRPPTDPFLIRMADAAARSPAGASSSAALGAEEQVVV